MKALRRSVLAIGIATALAGVTYQIAKRVDAEQIPANHDARASPFEAHALQLLAEGKQTFRFDTFGSEAFWGDTLKLHEAVAQQTLKKLQQAKPNKTKETKS